MDRASMYFLACIRSIVGGGNPNSHNTSTGALYTRPGRYGSQCYLPGTFQAPSTGSNNRSGTIRHSDSLRRVTT